MQFLVSNGLVLKNNCFLVIKCNGFNIYYALKITVHKNFAIFTGKKLCWVLFVLCWRLTLVFSCEYCEIFMNSYFYRKTLAAVSDINAEYILNIY